MRFSNITTPLRYFPYSSLPPRSRPFEDLVQPICTFFVIRWLRQTLFIHTDLTYTGGADLDISGSPAVPFRIMTMPVLCPWKMLEDRSRQHGDCKMFLARRKTPRNRRVLFDRYTRIIPSPFDIVNRGVSKLVLNDSRAILADCGAFGYIPAPASGQQLRVLILNLWF